MEELHSALELAKSIKEKKVSPVEVAKHYLKKIDEENETLNAIIWRNDEELLDSAKKAEDSVMKGDDLAPFHGIPTPVKDLTEVAGQPYTMGSNAMADDIGQIDSSIVTLAKNAGFLLMGRSNSPEFGVLPVTENHHFGATRNPWNPELTSGGSSGGAASAVASGMAPIALASDGGGSIRIPASCTGTVGLKPSRGRISRGPMITDVFHGFSTDGCISKTVEDSAAFLDCVSGFDRDAWYSAPKFEGTYLDSCRQKPGKLKIGYSLETSVPTEYDDEVIKGYKNTIQMLKDLGHEVFETKLPFNSAGNLTEYFLKVWNTSAAYIPTKKWDEAEPMNREMREVGLRLNSIEYVDAVVHLQIFSRIMSRFFHDNFDIFLSPTLAIEPPRVGWIFETGETDPIKLLMRCGEMVPSTAWVNISGQPAISLPTHWTDKGIPIGMQFVGQPFREDKVLQLAKQIEETCQWSQKY
jgi:amidase